ncbi:MAG: DinB family protein [Bacteroidota bacterium]
MNFQLTHSIEILERTPAVLTAWLEGLSGEWIFQNEGGDTWSPFDVVGHLIHGEKTDWIPRLKIILEHGDAKPFEPYDRFAQFEESKGKTLSQLLQEFTRLRNLNLEILKNTPLSEADLDRKGRHPALGEVTLRQLLATWTVHDLTHIYQISRVLARQYEGEVGVWKAYLGVLKTES